MMCTCLVTNHINSARSRPAPPVTTKGHLYDPVYPNPGEAAYNAATAVHDPLKEHDNFVIMAQPLLPHLPGAVYDRHLRGLGPWGPHRPTLADSSAALPSMLCCSTKCCFMSERALPSHISSRPPEKQLQFCTWQGAFG